MYLIYMKTQWTSALHLKLHTVILVNGLNIFISFVFLADLKPTLLINLVTLSYGTAVMMLCQLSAVSGSIYP